MYSRKQWATDVLIALGNKEPTLEVVSWLSAWTTFETPAPTPEHVGALYNLLNTTQRELGSTNFNSVGVQDYPTYQIGIKANAETISNGFYPHIYQGLTTNEIEILKNHPAVNTELNRWGTGSKQASINNNAQSHTGMSDQFPGNANPNQKVPEGWMDDGTTLTAPNSVKVVQGFRDWILNHDWDHNDMPLAPERSYQSLEESNSEIGSGTSQTFRMSRLEWTPSRGVFKGWLGVEYEYLLDKNTKEEAAEVTK